MNVFVHTLAVPVRDRILDPYLRDINVLFTRKATRFGLDPDLVRADRDERHTWLIRLEFQIVNSIFFYDTKSSELLIAALFTLWRCHKTEDDPTKSDYNEAQNH